MTNSEIVSLYRMVHMVVAVVRMMNGTIRAYRVMIVVPVAMIPIEMRSNAVIWSPPSWPIIPIVRRMPSYPRWSPEPIVDDRTIDIDWFDDIVGSVYIFITNDLYGNRLSSRVLLNEDRSDILVDILSKNSLYNNQVLIAISNLYNA